MMSLDDRARRAADAIQQSTAEYAPPNPFPVVVRRHRWVQFAQGAVAFAAVVLFIAIGALLRPTPEPDIAVTTPEPIIEDTPELVDDLPEIDVPPSPDTPIDPFDPGPPDEEPVDDVPVEQPTPPPVGEPLPPAEEPADVTPPEIVITSPKDGDRFDVETIWFEGSTEPGATVAAGRWRADVDAAGNWAIKLVLSEGANRASFTATDAAGNQARATVVVYFDPPPPPKDGGGDEEPPVDFEFSAHQVFGSCAEKPPYDVFWGTGQPGTVISITSEYGSGSVEVNAEGEWEVKVFFPESPLGEVFAVKVKDVHGNKKVFEFVHTEA